MITQQSIEVLQLQLRPRYKQEQRAKPKRPLCKPQDVASALSYARANSVQRSILQVSTAENLLEAPVRLLYAYVLEALEEALEKGCPEIFNTDRGSQFTSCDFTSKLLDASIEVSMDGRGRATDNVFIERLWRTVKYVEVYLKEYASGVETCRSLKRFFDYYDYDRPDQDLGNQTPWEVYRPRGRKRPEAAI